MCDFYPILPHKTQSPVGFHLTFEEDEDSVICKRFEKNALDRIGQKYWLLISVRFSILFISFFPPVFLSSSGSSFHTSVTSHISCPWPNKICFEPWPWSCFMNLIKSKTFSFLRHFQIKLHGLCAVVWTAWISAWLLFQAMPWHYFDGKLFQQKYIQRKRTSVSYEQLCDDKVSSKVDLGHKIYRFMSPLSL